MNVLVAAWPIKRLALARLAGIADGSLVPPDGSTALVATPSRPVQVSHFQPTNPERISVYGMPLRATARELTAEDPSMTGQIAFIEIRVRVFDPGEDQIGVDQQLGDMLSAVATALLEEPVFEAGRLWLSATSQEAQDLSPNPDPSVTGVASLVFAAEAVAYAG